MNHKELIVRLRVGAGIERERVVYSGLAPLADEAADAIEELQATATEYQQAADKMAAEHKVERDTLRNTLARIEAKVDSTIAERDTLRQQLAEAQSDAERYRFLISDASDSNGGTPEQSLLVDEVWQRVLDCGNNYTKDAVDFAIDAAMKGAA
jgi:septal ring factor EnvC (AmiA/AmiB activator)